MASLKKKYTKDNLTVVWQPDLCIHSRQCFKGLPQVFNPANKPWINMDAETVDQIKTQVNKCPSGALSYIIEESVDMPVNDVETINIDISENGPILIKGPVNIKYKGKKERVESKTLALCRCGESSNKPFCDGTHRRNSFTG